MALSFTKTLRTIEGVNPVVYGVVTFDDSYPTGGEAVDPALFGLTQVVHVSAEASVGATTGVLAVYDAAAETFVLYVSDAATGVLGEVEDEADVDGVEIPVRVVGV